VRQVTDPFVIARVLAVVALIAVALMGVVVLGATALRFAGRRPGRRWGTAFSFLIGFQAGVFLIFTAGDFVQRAALLAVMGVVTLWLMWRDRRVLAGAFVAGCAVPWAGVWGYYVSLLVIQDLDIEPFVTWTLFLAGAVVAVVGLALVAAGDPLPPEPSPTAPVGQPGSRKIGIVAQTVLAPESIGPIPISELAAFLAEVVVVLVVGAVGIPFPLEAVAQIGLATLAGNAARVFARPARARRAFEAFSWLAEWEIQRVKQLTGRGVPMTKRGVGRWLAEVPDAPQTRWFRVEALALFERLDEARAVAERMPVATPYERFERQHAFDYLDWMTGGEGDPDAVRAAAGEIEPADEEARLRAEVAMKIRESARIAAERGPEEALEPLLVARNLVGERAGNQLVRALWRRYLPISFVTAVVTWAILGAVT
jgi:hypothetical protein